MDNELILFDRIEMIKNVVRQYGGQKHFYLSFSGGKDSMVLHKLLDLALPGNFIPRVFCDTGIEFNSVRKFVKDLSSNDGRIFVIQAKTPIKKMLETDGYPFKSKEHSQILHYYQQHGLTTNWVKNYLEIGDKSKFKVCPNKLKYQFTPEFKMNISDKCCSRLKTEPLEKFQAESKRDYAIVGVRRSEGGRRTRAKCLLIKDNKLRKFQPLVVIDSDWENWFIAKYDIKLCELYYPPYNFQRTGCKGCPFNPNLQEELDVLEMFFPSERKQCEIIWKPVYDEYRKLNYRLRPLQVGRKLF